MDFLFDRITFRALKEVSELAAGLGAVEEDSLELAVFLTFSYTKRLPLLLQRRRLLKVESFTEILC